METFIKNYNYIVNNYYGSVDEEKLLDAALEGVLNALEDPYTTYIDETEVDNFNIQLEGSYQGLGIEMYNSNKNELTILTVFDNSPASEAELKPGDIFIKLDGQDITGLTSQEFSEKIRNKNNTKFVLTVKRNQQELDIEVETNNVTLTSAVSRIIETDNKKIGYLGISIFANNTYTQVREELKKVESKGIDSLIIDVRGNTGGHLTSVENILGLFLDSTHIIYKTKSNDKIDAVYSSGKETKTYPIVILTNEMSASASEIDGVGVAVDLEVEFDSNYYTNPSDENDTQLQAAIKMIKE